MSSRLAGLEKSSNGYRDRKGGGGTGTNAKKMTIDKTIDKEDVSNKNQIQSLLKEEGRSARNLVSWNVPFEQSTSSPADAEHDESLTGVNCNNDSFNKVQHKSPSKRYDEHSSSSNRYQRRIANNSNNTFVDYGTGSITTTPRKSKNNVLSSSASSGQHQVNLVNEKVKFWTFLIDNLDRAIDALYSVCEQNEGIQQASEMKMLLTNYVKDFDNLIDRIKIQQDFDKAEEKPLSISWEVRKTSSPMKAPTTAANQLSASGSNSGSSSTMRQLMSSMSWADRVRGAVVSQQQHMPNNVTTDDSKLSPQTEHSNLSNGGGDAIETEKEEEEEGWEKFSKHKSKVNNSKIKAKEEVTADSNVKSSSVEEKIQSPLASTHLSQPNSVSHQESVVNHGDSTASDRQKVEDNEQESSFSKGDSSDLNVTDDVTTEGEWGEEEEEDEESEGNTEVEKAIDNELNECYQIALKECEEEETQLVHQLEDISLQSVPPSPPSFLPNEEEEEEFEEKESNKGTRTKDAAVDATDINSHSGNNDSSSSGAVTGGLIDFALSWADLVEEEEENRRMVSNRDPSRALIIHERLSSPSRTSSWAEKKWRHEEKQRKAQELRAKALEETMLKQRNLALRIQEVRRFKYEILDQKKKAYEKKLKEADYKRKAHLRKIVTKAHEEENKVNEIAFIMTLEAQNKRAEIKSKHEVYEARKQEIEVGRLRKLEETRALEEAAKERRKVIEIEKENRLGELQTKRETHMQRISALQSAKELERAAITRKREEERGKKLALVVERERESVEGLVKRLQEKQDESEARYKQLLSERQQRAAELAHGHNTVTAFGDCAAANTTAHVVNTTPSIANSVTNASNSAPCESAEKRNEGANVASNEMASGNAPPSIEPFANPKMCFLCNFQLRSEVDLMSHQRGKRHLESLRKELNRSETPTEHDSERLSWKFIGDVTSKSDTVFEVADTKAYEERLNNMKKRLKKVKTRMNQRAKEFELQIANNNSNENKNSNNAAVKKDKESTNSTFTGTSASENKSKIQKLLKEISKQMASAGTAGSWPENKVAVLDRSLGELDRLFSKTVNNKSSESIGVADRACFREQSGYAVICRVLLLANENFEKPISVIPTKSQSLAASVLLNSCMSPSTDNCRYLLYSNKISPLIDIINNHMSVILKNLPRSGPSTLQPLPHSQLVLFLCSVVALVFDNMVKYALANEVSISSASNSSKSKQTISGNSSFIQIPRPLVSDQCKARITDAISYLVCCGLLDKISDFYHGIRKSVYSDFEGAAFLTSLMDLVNSATQALQVTTGQLIMEPVSDDFTFLVTTFKQTELLGCVSLLYGTLLHSDVLQQQSSATSAANQSQVELNELAHNNSLLVPPVHVLKLAKSTLSFLNSVALIDTTVAQEVLSEESLSLQLRHIASNLFNNCAAAATNLKHASLGSTSTNKSKKDAAQMSSSVVSSNEISALCADLMHQVILTIGYFTLFNADNQLIIQAGSPPTLLQQLCTALPFHYFSDESRMDVLFPTLVASCHKNVANRNILQTEITPELLASYLKNKKEKLIAMTPVEVSMLVISGSKFDLLKRLPVHCWTEAIDFFSSAQ